MDLYFPQTRITVLQEEEDPHLRVFLNIFNIPYKISPYLVLLFLLSTGMAPVPICTVGQLGKGWLWNISSGVRSTSVGLTITLAAESRAVFPLL